MKFDNEEAPQPNETRRNPEIKTIKVPQGLPHPFWHTANRYQFWYSIVGLVFGTAFAGSGVALFLHGVFGKTSWTADILGAHSNVSDAAPGTIFAIVGLFVIFVTRYGVKSGR